MAGNTLEIGRSVSKEWQVGVEIGYLGPQEESDDLVIGGIYRLYGVAVTIIPCFALTGESYEDGEIVNLPRDNTVILNGKELRYAGYDNGYCGYKCGTMPHHSFSPLELPDEIPPHFDLMSPGGYYATNGMFVAKRAAEAVIGQAAKNA